MGAPVDIGTIPVCAGQAFQFSVDISGPVADAAYFDGMVVAGQIRKYAPVSTALVVPTIVVGSPVEGDTLVTVTALVSVTEAQAAALTCTSDDFTTPTNYYINLEAAYSDAPTVEAVRFYGVIAVYQGGLSA